MHRSAWKENSANFALTAFSEVRVAPVLGGRFPACTRSCTCCERAAAKWPACSRAHPRLLEPSTPGTLPLPYGSSEDHGTEREARECIANRSSSTRAPASGKRGQKKK